MTRRPAVTRLAQTFPAEIERSADRGTTDEGAWRVVQRGGESGGALAVTDHRPVDHHLLLIRTRPFDEADGDRAIFAGGDGLQHARIGHGRGIAVALQLELVVIDAARHVGGQNQRQINVFGARAERTKPEECGERHTREHRAHRHLLDIDTPA
jgi:hypothetical protein